MYQWVEESKSETRKQLGGSEETVTTYSYHKEWNRREINSGSFRQSGHDNPQKPIDDASFPVASATIGAFGVSGRTAANLGDDRPVPLNALDATRVEPRASAATCVDRERTDDKARNDDCAISACSYESFSQYVKFHRPRAHSSAHPFTCRLTPDIP